MTQERVSIVIDGSNFYHRLRELQLGNLLQFNYGAFSDFLSRARTCVERKYYIAPIREELGNLKSRELMHSSSFNEGRYGAVSSIVDFCYAV